VERYYALHCLPAARAIFGKEGYLFDTRNGQQHGTGNGFGTNSRGHIADI